MTERDAAYTVKSAFRWKWSYRRRVLPRHREVIPPTFDLDRPMIWSSQLIGVILFEIFSVPSWAVSIAARGARTETDRVKSVTCVPQRQSFSWDNPLYPEL